MKLKQTPKAILSLCVFPSRISSSTYYMLTGGYSERCLNARGHHWVPKNNFERKGFK